jgi:hypothetical protein
LRGSAAAVSIYLTAAAPCCWHLVGARRLFDREAKVVTEDERVEAVCAEFARRGFVLDVQESSRGAARGGWFAIYRRRSDPPEKTRLAHGKTKLEAAELALAALRNEHCL